MSTTIPSILPTGNFGVAQSGAFGGSPLTGIGSFGSFESFFAALLGGALSEGESTDLLSMLQNSENFAEGELPDFTQSLQSLFALTGQSDLQLDEDLFSAEVSFEELLVEIKQEINFLVKNGVQPTGIVSIDELSAAYEELGLSPQAAQEKAIRITTALELLQKKTQETPPNGETSSQVLAAIFSGLTSKEQNSALEVISQRTEVKVQRLMASLNTSQKLSTGDVALQVLEGKPLTSELQTSTAVERARVLEQLQANTATTESLNSELAAKKHKAEDALAKAVEIVEQKSGSVPENLQRVLRKLTGEAPATTAGENTVPVQTSEVSESEVRKGRNADNARPEPLFSVRVNDSGEFVAENVADFLDDVAATESKNTTEAVEEILDEGLDLVNRRTEGVQRAEGGSSLERMAKQAEITTQVNVKVRQLAANGGGQIKMLLNPPQLGEVEISLEINNRAVKGQIVVQTQEVAEQLARDLRHLQQGLADAGLELSKEGITFLLQDQNSFEEQITDDENDSSSGGWASANADESEAVESPARWRNVDQMVDVEV